MTTGWTVETDSDHRACFISIDAEGLKPNLSNKFQVPVLDTRLAHGLTLKNNVA